MNRIETLISLSRRATKGTVLGAEWATPRIVPGVRVVPRNH